MKPFIKVDKMKEAIAKARKIDVSQVDDYLKKKYKITNSKEYIEKLIHEYLEVIGLD